VYRTGLAFTVLAIALSAQPAQPAPAGFSLEDRWTNYLERTYSWKRIGMVGAESAFDQTFQLNKCGRPPYCFPHHFGGSLARRTARTTIEFGAGALLKEDLRRTPSGLSGFRERLMWALTHSALAKGGSGEWRPAYSRYAGTLGGSAVSAAWKGEPITAGRLGRSLGWAFTAYLQDSVMAELEPVLRGIGRQVWRSRFGPRTRTRESRDLLPRF